MITNKLKIRFFPYFLPLFLVFLISETALGQAKNFDYLSPIIEIENDEGRPQQPIHVSLLPDGRLFLSALPFVLTTTPFWDFDFPEKVVVTNNISPLPAAYPGIQLGIWTIGDLLSCSGHGLTEDGTLFYAGGTREWHQGPLDDPETTIFGLGLPNAVIFHPATDTWSLLKNMIGKGTKLDKAGVRWYPTVTRLANSNILVTSGHEIISVTQNRSVEFYDISTGEWQILSEHNESPGAIFNRDYTHVFQLPDRINGTFDILMLGEFGKPVFMSTDGAERWLARSNFRPETQFLESSNAGATTTLLPLRLNDNWGYSNGSVVIVGGKHHTNHEKSIDIYDPFRDVWLPRIDAGIRRHHPSAIILPDSRILVIAGHNEEGNLDTGFAQYLDPAENFSLTLGTVEMPETRGYHTISVLLPDGRIFLGGGNNDGDPGNEKPNFRYYYPDYMFKPRPDLMQVQETLKVGEPFWVLTRDKTPISEIVLVAPGSMTHSFDMSQRLIQLEIVWSRDFDEHTMHISQAPLTVEIAPPGYYMLFVLDNDRVPSVARMIKLTR